MVVSGRRRNNSSGVDDGRAIEDGAGSARGIRSLLAHRHDCDGLHDSDAVNAGGVAKHLIHGPCEAIDQPRLSIEVVHRKDTGRSQMISRRLHRLLGE